MNNSKKDKKWQEELKGKISKLRERAKEEPKRKPKIIYADASGKSFVIEKDGYAEIKLVEEEKVEKKPEYAEIKLVEEEKVEKKPEMSFKIEKENHYAVIRPIVNNIKERAKEELIEEKIKSEQVVKEKEKEKLRTPEEKRLPAKAEYVGLETSIDKMIDIVDKRGSVTTFELSKELGVSIEQIDNWAKILEDRGLIDIEYPLIGPSKLRKKQWKKEP
jgi:hypothetical protein